LWHIVCCCETQEYTNSLSPPVTESTRVWAVYSTTNWAVSSTTNRLNPKTTINLSLNKHTSFTCFTNYNSVLTQDTTSSSLKQWLIYQLQTCCTCICTRALLVFVMYSHLYLSSTCICTWDVLELYLYLYFSSTCICTFDQLLVTKRIFCWIQKENATSLQHIVLTSIHLHFGKHGYECNAKHNWFVYDRTSNHSQIIAQNCSGKILFSL